MITNRFFAQIAGGLAMVAVLAASGFLLGCSEADGAEGVDVQREAPKRVIRVQTSPATVQNFEERISLTGVVEAEIDVTISAEASGRVDWIAPLGTKVDAGSVVARLDDRLLKSRVVAAKSEYELAETTFERQRALFADSIISALEFENVQTRRDQAQANYAQASKQFEDTQLKSQTAGRVEVRYVEAGELVNPGMPVVRVVDTRQVKIVAGVPERYAADIAEGAKVSIRLPAVGIETEAAVSFVGRVVNPQSRTFPVEIEIGNESGLLKPEMVADVSIQRRTVDDAIVIPQNAIVRDDLGTGVFVVERESGDLMANRRDVVTGPSFGGETVIVSGLSPGDEVVVVGQSRLTDSNLVEIAGE